MLKTGDIVAGKYEILRKVGRGGMSTVWLSMDSSLNKQWAVKEVHKDTKSFKATVNMNKVLSEADLMKKLDHPALPRIVDIIDSEDALYIIMDYIEGEPLSTVLDMYGKQKQETVVEWALDLCDVLSYLHHQTPPIIYRDMKPANIMLKPDGAVKVIDFGIAREYKEENIEDTVSLGTKGYAAPEQFRGRGQTDERTDIYNLGVTIYQLLTGNNPAEPPYQVLPLTECDRSLSTGLEKIIAKCTETNPDKRYQTVEELAYAISNYHKLEESYIKEYQNKLRRFAVVAFITVCSLIAGAGCLIVNQVLINNQYETYLDAETTNASARQARLLKAIDIKPDTSDAYQQLIKEYSKDGFTEDESATFFNKFNQHKDSIKKNEESAYQSLSFAIGENYLMYYEGVSDNSLRNKLLTAEPFFTAVVDGPSDYANYKTAQCYVFLAHYYEDYVISNNVLTVKEASKKECEKMIKNCEDCIKNLDTYTGEDKKHLQLSTYELILNMIDSEKEIMKAQGISQGDITNIIVKIYQKTLDIEPRVEISQEKKSAVLASYTLISNKIKALYGGE